MCRISIVIPVYNVEKYIRKCLDSVVNQTFGDLEIILVDDGSSDSSGDICDEYARQDSRINVIHKKNGGLSEARNTGIEVATGEFIAFVDSDDYIALNMIQTLYDNIERDKADIAVCGIMNVYREHTWPQCKENTHFICGNVEGFRLLLVGEKIPGSICNKLLRTELIKEIRFPSGKHYEDIFFHTDLMQVIDKISVDTTPLYYYVHRRDSVTTRKFEKSSMDIIEAYERNLKVIIDKYPQLIDVAIFRVQWANFVVLDRMMEGSYYWKIEEYEQVKKMLKKNALKIVKSPYFFKTRKLAALLLFINIKLYYLVSRYYKRKNEKLF